MKKPRPSDPNPDGITRFKDFCVRCDGGIKRRTSPSYRLIEGVKHYTCESCRKELSDVVETVNKLDDVFDRMGKSFDDLAKSLDKLFDSHKL